MGSFSLCPLADSTFALQGILQIDPEHRLTPWQALQHPFMTDQPFMGSFTPPPEPLEFSPNPHPSPSSHHRQRTHHPSSMATGVSAQQYAQVSPYGAAHSPFAATHTGSTVSYTHLTLPTILLV